MPRSTTNLTEVTSVRIPPDERAKMDELADCIGTSRSRLMRAAFSAVRDEDPAVLREWIEKLPPSRRGVREVEQAA